MSLLSRRGINNPLIRRVQRHQNLTTLFRTAEPMAAPTGQLVPRSNLVALPMQMIPHQPLEPSDLRLQETPIVHNAQIPAEVTQGYERATAKPGSDIRPAPYIPVASSRSSEVATERASASAFATPPQPLAQPAAPGTTRNETVLPPTSNPPQGIAASTTVQRGRVDSGDREWNRLQSIRQLHQRLKERSAADDIADDTEASHPSAAGQAPAQPRIDSGSEVQSGETHPPSAPPNTITLSSQSSSPIQRTNLPAADQESESVDHSLADDSTTRQDTTSLAKGDITDEESAASSTLKQNDAITASPIQANPVGLARRTSQGTVHGAARVSVASTPGARTSSTSDSNQLIRNDKSTSSHEEILSPRSPPIPLSSTAAITRSGDIQSKSHADPNEPLQQNDVRGGLAPMGVNKPAQQLVNIQRQESAETVEANSNSTPDMSAVSERNLGESRVGDAKQPTQENTIDSPIELVADTGTTHYEVTERLTYKPDGASIQPAPIASSEPDLKQQANVDDTETADQPPPLQNIWPGVKRIQRSSAESTLNTDSDEKEGAISAPRIPRLGQLEQAEISHAVERALDKVKPGQPTDSSIHVIPPRHPRPSIQRATQRKPTSPKGQRAPQIQNMDNMGSQAGRVEDGSFRGFGQRTELATELSDQGEFAPQNRAMVQRTVETEIGPLPADLWHLVGEPLPLSAPMSTQKPAPPSGPAAPKNALNEQSNPWTPSHSEPSHAIQRATLVSSQTGAEIYYETSAEPRDEPQMAESNEIARGKLETTASSFESASADFQNRSNRNPMPSVFVQHSNDTNQSNGSSNAQTIQLFADAPEQTNSLLEQTVSGAMTEVVSEVGQQETPSPQIDTDELARQVYQEIRRRLIIERERF